MSYLTPGFWESCPERREKAQKESLQNDVTYITSNQKIDFDILQAEKFLATKQPIDITAVDVTTPST